MKRLGTRLACQGKDIGLRTDTSVTGTNLQQITHHSTLKHTQVTLSLSTYIQTQIDLTKYLLTPSFTYLSHYDIYDNNITGFSLANERHTSHIIQVFCEQR